MTVKNLSQLFCQLGYLGSTSQIDYFVAHHQLRCGEEMTAASFWTPEQAAFLIESFELDSDWSGAADDLAVRLS
jgi:Protein of unknown function (DUF2789)